MPFLGLPLMTPFLYFLSVYGSTFSLRRSRVDSRFPGLASLIDLFSFGSGVHESISDVIISPFFPFFVTQKVLFFCSVHKFAVAFLSARGSRKQVYTGGGYFCIASVKSESWTLTRVGNLSYVLHLPAARRAWHLFLMSFRGLSSAGDRHSV
ncbi:hypothetical protein EV126DRAFT_217401 [Verticillium dahliae]|nr:hypothetical protein EV126DRAFT_217401 [Verticillium dahliae]